MDFYIIHRGQSVFWVLFVDLVFFVATKYRLSFGFILGLIFFRVWLCWIWHIPCIWVFWVWFGTCTFYVIFWFHFRNLSFFSVSPLGLLGFFGLVIFLGIWYPGLVFYSEFGCVPLDIYWYLLYLFPLYFTHLFIPYLLITCTFFLQLLVTVLSIVWSLVRWILNPTL